MSKKSANEAKYYWLFGMAVTIALILGLYFGLNVMKPWQTREIFPDNPKTQQVGLSVGGVDLRVEVRDDDEERSLGMSGRRVMGKDEGMLFVFKKADQPMFWMKDMLIDLDVVWIRGGQVVALEEDVPAPTKEEPRLRTMTPGTDVDMVLEVPAGWVQENEVKLGDSVEVKSNG